MGNVKTIPNVDSLIAEGVVGRPGFKAELSPCIGDVATAKIDPALYKTWARANGLKAKMPLTLGGKLGREIVLGAKSTMMYECN